MTDNRDNACNTNALQKLCADTCGECGECGVQIGLRFTRVGPSTQKLLSCVLSGKSILFIKRDVTNVCSYVTGDK